MWRRLLLAVAAVCVVTLQMSCVRKEKEKKEECCRDLQTPIWYNLLPDHLVYEGDSTILRADTEKGATVITISAPEFQGGGWSGHSLICSSRDTGEHWDCVLEGGELSQPTSAHGGEEFWKPRATPKSFTSTWKRGCSCVPRTGGELGSSRVSRWMGRPRKSLLLTSRKRNRTGWKWTLRRLTLLGH